MLNRYVARGDLPLPQVVLGNRIVHRVGRCDPASCGDIVPFMGSSGLSMVPCGGVSAHDVGQRLSGVTAEAVDL